MAVALYACFFVKERKGWQVVEGPGRVPVFGFLDEVGVFQRAGRREGELGGLFTFEVRKKAVIQTRREMQGME